MKGYRWIVDPPPTGRYKSFHTRGWPSLIHTESGRCVAFLACRDPYEPWRLKTNDHAFIHIWLVGNKVPNEKLDKSYATLALAKAAAQDEVYRRM